MEKKIFYIAFCLLSQFGFAQHFINGDFEDNFATICEYNLTDSIFNQRIKHIKAIGKKQVFGELIGEIDLQTFDCMVTPKSGNWCLGLNSDNIGTSDAISIELSEPLSPNKSYELSFFVFANTVYENTPAQLEIGESEVDSIFGTTITYFKPISKSWDEGKFVFSPIGHSKYITARLKHGSAGWNQIDNFAIYSVPKENVNCKRFKDISYSPNPVVDYIQINLQSQIPGGIIKVYNPLGQLVISKDMDTSLIHQIDFSGLAEGAYFISIECKDERKSFQVVKIRSY